MIVRWNYTHKLIPYTDIPNCLQNDSLYLNDINGRQYVNKINKVDDETIMFEGIADVKDIQIYHK